MRETEVSMKKSLRLFSVLTTAVIGATAAAMFAGCDTNYPEVTITYEFRGEEYAVDYTLTRKGAPQTVQHFIELADTGYYDGTVIHDYQTNGTFLYGGAYTMEDGELKEKDYWTELRNYEKEHGFKYSQTVFANGKDMANYIAERGGYSVAGENFTAESARVPLYTLHGEFSSNGVTVNSKAYQHSKGVLGMYYTAKGSDATSVRTVRSDGGANNDNEAEQEGARYKTNCATSIFYTYTGEGNRSDLDGDYVAFGMAKDYSQIQTLIEAINDYSASLVDEEGQGLFTTSQTVLANQYDPIDLVRNAKIYAEYNVPVEPITIKSVKVTTY